jgi:hypothetical protein
MVRWYLPTSEEYERKYGHNTRATNFKQNYNASCYVSFTPTLSTVILQQIFPKRITIAYAVVKKP